MLTHVECNSPQHDVSAFKQVLHEVQASFSGILPPVC